jgi:hypothetical protein
MNSFSGKIELLFLSAAWGEHGVELGLLRLLSGMVAAYEKLYAHMTV